jgi:nucleoside-diphosphate-sugar epimerase
MNFTVLGSSGFIGSHLVKHLTAIGHTVFTPTRHHEFDRQKNMGHVIYAIGMTADFRKYTFETVEAHVSHLSKVLQHTQFTSFLYLSSTRIYGQTGDGLEDSAVCVNPNDASDIYNLSKLMGESICLNVNHPHVRIARLSNVIGPHQPKSSNFLDAITSDALLGKIHLESHLDSSKNYVALGDVLELIPKIALHGCHKIYNIASANNTSHREFVDLLVQKFGCTVSSKPDAKVISMAQPSIQKIYNEFHFRPSGILECFAAASAQISRKLN